MAFSNSHGGKLEIPYTSLVEFTVNSLVHRSLNMKAPVRIFIFDNRVEIHSPGALPNGLTIDDIKAGTSMPRNMFLFNNAIYLLPYTGVGKTITLDLDTLTPTMTLDLDTLTLQKCHCLTSKGT